MVKEGKQEYFFRGKLRTVEHYVQGKLHGEVLLYWPNGILKRKCSFHLGVRQGLDQMWSPEGQLLDEGVYRGGWPIGLHRRWSETGKLIEEITYLENGRFQIRQWDERGELRLETKWEEENYLERAWDRFEKVWIEKKGFWDGNKLIYL